MRESKIGKDLTEKQVKSLQEGRGKKNHTEETYRKLSLSNRGEGSATSKLKEGEVIEILTHIKNKSMSYNQMSKKYNISITQISRIKNGIRWSYIKERRPDLYE